MGRSAKALGLVVVSFLAAIVLAIGSAFAAALAFGATALIVPGTGTPDATNVAGYMTNARDYYLGGTACTDDSCTLSSISYPASFFPLAVIPGWCVPGRCEKWDDSVALGVANLDMQLQQALMDPDEQIIIFGYSQGGAVVTNELLNLKDTLSDADKARIQVVVIGNVDNPAGGLFTRLGFLGTVPFFDVTTGIATPIDTGIPITSIRFEYDGVSDAPKYFGNPLAVLNALAGFQYIHGTYLAPNQNGEFQGLPNGYTPAELSVLINDPANAKFDAAGNKYILIPTRTLPIVQPFLDLAMQTGTTPLVKPIIDLISPTLRVLINLGYDRNEDPGVNSPLSILPFNPFINPVQLTIDLIAAVIQGIQDALGGVTALAPSVPAPLTTTTLAARSIAPQADVAQQPDLPGGPATVSSLSSVSEKSTVTATPMVAEVNETKDATAVVPAMEPEKAVEPGPTSAPEEPIKPVETVSSAATEKAKTDADEDKTDADEKDAEAEEKGAEAEEKGAEADEKGADADQKGADADANEGADANADANANAANAAADAA